MITVSRAIGNKWNVASGLEQGDKVIVEGIQRVRPGMAVKVVPFDSTQKDSAETGKNANPPEKTTPPPEKAK
jgi:membrane fusion protein (multidrug efflux system)